jgi:hypothetical protein
MNNIRRRGLSPKRIRRFQAQKVAPVAQHHVRFEWQLGKQSRPEFCTRLWLADDKGSRRAYVHDIVFAQLPCEDAGAKGSVSANINAAKEDDESHTLDYEEKSQDALGPLAFATVHGLAPSRLAINCERPGTLVCKTLDLDRVS